MAKNKHDFVSDKRLYLDADGNVVNERDSRRVRLLVGAGGSMPRADAERYGLVKTEAVEVEDGGADAEDVEAPDGETPTTHKAVSIPPAGKRTAKKITGKK